MLYEQFYKNRGYSSKYGKAIDNLIVWFSERLNKFKSISITKADYKNGIDRLPTNFRLLTTDAFNQFLKDGYELSYNQLCIAFFEAAKQSNVVNVLKA